MADFDEAYKRIMKFEGGYVPEPAETYKGIYRNDNPNWSGWVLIDGFKKQYGAPKKDYLFPTIPQLEPLVKEWYVNTYFKNKVDFASIKSQTVADMVLDFVVHKNYQAITVINAAAKSLSPSVQTATSKLSSGVLSVINSASSSFYKVVKSYRIQYYKDPSKFGSTYKFSSNMVNKNFIPRVNTFPTDIID